MPDGIKKVIENWYDLYSDSVYKYIILMIHDYQQAEDLTQETFIKAHKYYRSFEERASPRTWLFSIAHNITVDYIRKQKPILMVKDNFFTNIPNETSLEGVVQKNENSEELYIALRKLKRSYREVMILRKIKGFSIEETAEILKWSKSKVKSTLYRAMNALEKQLIKEGFIHERRI